MAESRITYRPLGFGIAGAIFVVDQLTKWLIMGPLALPERGLVTLASFFDLRWVENYGVSMGFLIAASDKERWILVAMTLARFAWIFGCDGVIALRRKFGWRRFETMGFQASTVLSWAGMRGVVTLAVALSVPADLPGRDFILVAAFAVILVTVLLQGTTLGLVIARLRPREAGAHVAPLTMSQAEAAMAQA